VPRPRLTASALWTQVAGRAAALSEEFVAVLVGLFSVSGEQRVRPAAGRSASGGVTLLEVREGKGEEIVGR
jgi:hypothetical protein